VNLQIPKTDDALGIVLKIPGETCNINCHYCYEKRKPYPGSGFLTPDVLRKFLRVLGNRPICVMLHGGEPLLAGRERMRSLLDVLREYSASVSLSIQTNGLLLNDKWLDFFDQHWPSIEIGVSLDGDLAGNVHRVDYRGKLTYHKVVQALDLLADRSRSCGVIVVVTRYLLGRANAVIDEMMRHRAIRNVKLSPCLDYRVTSKQHRGVTGRQINLLNPGANAQPGWATSPAEYGQFLREAFVYWRDKKAYRSFLLEPLVSIIRALNGQSTGFTHFDTRKDPFVVTVYPDGRIGSCDELAMPDALLGHVDDGLSMDDLLKNAQGGRLFQHLDTLMSSCAGCRVAEVCRGGSLPDRARYDEADQHAGYCQSRIEVIDSVRELIG
jgi:radical SAM protein with 4Fe4S-binding SPASM domain